MLKKKQNIKNSVFNYMLSSIFNLPILHEKNFLYIVRCFSMAADNKEFADLDFEFFMKIIKNPQLEITSEVEVFECIDAWISRHFEFRAKFGKDLLINVRLPLIPEHAIRRILAESSSLRKIDDCVALIKRFLMNKESFCQEKKHLASRSCLQENFSVLISGGSLNSAHFRRRRSLKSIIKFDMSNEAPKRHTYPPMKIDRCGHRAVLSKGGLFVLGGYKNYEGVFVRSVRKYTFETKTWSLVAYLPEERHHFCATALLGHIFLIGGSLKGRGRTEATAACARLNTGSREWAQIGAMREARLLPSCVLRRGGVLVSGGSGRRTLESYDFHADRWRDFGAEMMAGRSGHGSAVSGDKVFVVGGSSSPSCECFDPDSRVFVALKPPPESVHKVSWRRRLEVEAHAIGGKIFVVGGGSEHVLAYCMEKEQWEKVARMPERCEGFACTIVPNL